MRFSWKRVDVVSHFSYICIALSNVITKNAIAHQLLTHELMAASARKMCGGT